MKRIFLSLFLFVCFPCSSFAYVAGPDPIFTSDGSCREVVVAVAGCFQLDAIYELHLWGNTREEDRVLRFSATSGRQDFDDIQIRVNEDGIILSYDVDNVSLVHLYRDYGGSLVRLYDDIPNCNEAREPRAWQRYFRRFLRQIRNYE